MGNRVRVCEDIGSGAFRIVLRFKGRHAGKGGVLKRVVSEQVGERL